MLYQNYSFEQSQNQIFSVLKDLQIAKLLYKANIRKGCGLSALEMFQRLVMLVFHGKNLFRSLESKHNDHAASKSTYYRFLSNPSFNWKKFLLLLAIRVTTALRKLTCKSRVTVLVLDDSVLRRNRSKAVELMCFMNLSVASTSWHLAGRTASASFLFPLCCFRRPSSGIATRKPTRILTTAPTAGKPGWKA